MRLELPFGHRSWVAWDRLCVPWHIQPEKLAAAATTETETAQIQRLGWLLDHLGQTTLADALHAARTGHTSRNRWRIVENTQPEADL